MLRSVVRPLGVYTLRDDMAAMMVAPGAKTLMPEGECDLADDGPLEFLQQVRLEIDSPKREMLERQEFLSWTANRLREILDDGLYDFHAAPSFLLCRLSDGVHSQTGIVADVSLEAYRSGVIKPHEATHQDKEDLLVEYMNSVRASFLPVSLIHKPLLPLAQIIENIVNRDPAVDIQKILAPMRIGTLDAGDFAKETSIQREKKSGLYKFNQKFLETSLLLTLTKTININVFLTHKLIYT